MTASDETEQRAQESSGSGTGPAPDATSSEAGPRISDFLKPERIRLELETASRKRLFEFLAELAVTGLDEVTEDEIFKTLTQRERLGCTGLGRGIAVPHGRIEQLETPVIAIARLKHPVDYDAPDNRPVWLAVGLLVPGEANDTHLKLLSVLATCFQNESFVNALKSCDTPQAVVALFDEYA